MPCHYPAVKSNNGKNKKCYIERFYQTILSILLRLVYIPYFGGIMTGRFLF